MELENSSWLFKIGDKVLVRDTHSTSWLNAVVATASPLEVQVEGWPVPMAFNYVRLHTNDNEGRKKGFQMLNNLDLYWIEGNAPACGINPEHWGHTVYYDYNVHHLCPQDGNALRKAWREYERENAIWCSEAPVMEIVFSFLIDVTKSRPDSDSDDSHGYERWFFNDSLKHIIGLQGKTINKIRKQTLATITIFDGNSVGSMFGKNKTLEKGPIYYNGRITRGNSLLKIEGTHMQIEAAKERVQKIFSTVAEYEQKHQQWLRRKRRRCRRRAAYTWNDAKTPWVKDQWYLQKQQHGADGWYISKYKNKGKRRGQTKKSKRARDRAANAKLTKKTKRKHKTELSNRRFRLSI